MPSRLFSRVLGPYFLRQFVLLPLMVGALLGKAAGYDFDFTVQLSDTMDSHRLVLWAERRAGKGEAVAHAMGRRYFEGARPLADRAMLRDVGEEPRQCTET